MKATFVRCGKIQWVETMARMRDNNGKWKCTRYCHYSFGVSLINTMFKFIPYSFRNHDTFGLIRIIEWIEINPWNLRSNWWPIWNFWMMHRLIVTITRENRLNFIFNEHFLFRNKKSPKAFFRAQPSEIAINYWNSVFYIKSNEYRIESGFETFHKEHILQVISIIRHRYSERFEKLLCYAIITMTAMLIQRTTSNISFVNYVWICIWIYVGMCCLC